MLIYSLDRSAAIAWSPLAHKPNFLAVGTMAGTLDLDFNTSAHLEIFTLNFGEESKEGMTVSGKTSASDRFSKLVWGNTGVQNGTFPYGLIVGGLANGAIHIWNPASILGEKSDDPLIAKIEKHTSGVQGLEFNPFVSNLLASGSADSEIFIYDISNTASPTVYTPGNSQRTQSSGITSVVWNRKVQHILASSSLSGVTVVWDLKAKRPVLEFSDPNKKLQCRAIAWNPEEATQLVTASADDSVPIIQFWDLRNTYTPTKVLEGHQKGIWSLAWCPMDIDLLISCGRDNRTVCWNVRSGEAMFDVEQNSWNNDAHWSPRIPAILSTSSLEGKVKVLSVQDVQSSTQTLPGVATNRKPTLHAPKWLKRPAGVAFGFGGKIVTFRKPKTANDPRVVKISSMATDTDIVERAEKLQQAVESDQFKSFCEEKLAAAKSEEDKTIWQLLLVMFDAESQRPALLRHLGFDSQEIAAKLEEFTGSKQEGKQEEKESSKEEGEQKGISSLFPSQETPEEFLTASKKAPPPKDTSPISYQFDNDTEGLITRALVVGNLEAAVDCCIANNRLADALVLAAYGGGALWNKAQEAFFHSQTKSQFTKVMAAVVKEELRELIERADLDQWKVTLAILCTYAKTEEFALLCSLLGNKLYTEKADRHSALLCYICAGHIDQFVQLWEKNNEQAHSIQSLLDLVEKITLFRKAFKYREPLSERVTTKYSQYAQLLASQGKLEPAVRSLSFLLETKYEDTSSPAFVILDRLYHALRLNIQPPPFPFKREELPYSGPQRPAQPSRAPAQGGGVSPSMPGSPSKTVPVTRPDVGRPGIPPPTFISSSSSVPSAHHGTVAPPPSILNPPPSISGNIPPPSFVPPQSSVPSYGVSGNPPPSTHVAPPPSLSGIQPPPSLGIVPPPMIPKTTPTTAPPMTGPPPVATPPPVTGPPPVATHPPVVGPPPVSSPPVGRAPQAKPATPTQEVSSEEIQKLIADINTFVDSYSQSSNDKAQKIAADVKKRLPVLFEKFTRNLLSAEAIQEFQELSQALLSKNVNGAQTTLQAITKNHWESIGSTPMIGVKRLVELLNY